MNKQYNMNNTNLQLDIFAIAGGKRIKTLQTLAYDIHEETPVVTGTFNALPAKFSSNPQNIFCAYEPPVYLYDKMPPFDILICSINENNNITTIRLLGCEVVEEDFILSVDDFINKTFCSFIAHGIDQ